MSRGPASRREYPCEFVFVDDQDIDVIEQSIDALGHWSDVEHHQPAQLGRRACSVTDQCLRGFELQQENVTAAHVPQSRADGAFGQLGVGAGGDDDRVSTVVVDRDECAAGRCPGYNVHMPDVDALFDQCSTHDGAVGVVAGGTDHDGGRTGTRCSDGLVCTLAAGTHNDLGAENGFASLRYPAHANAVVGVEAADDVGRQA